jgi:heptosyltransferase II
VSKILIIQTAFLGDVILVTPLLRAVRQELPGCQVTMMITPETKNIVEENPFVKNLWIFDKHNRDKGIKHFKYWVNKIKEEKFEIGLLPHRSYRSALLMKMAKIPIRIGFDRSPAKLTYSHSIKYAFKDHEISRNLSLLKQFGVSNLGIIRPEIYPSEKDVTFLNELFDDHKITSKSKLVALAPGSIWFTKRWPVTHFLDLTNLFLESGFDVCLIGGKKDLHLGDYIQEKAKKPVINFMDKLTLRQSAELLKRCSVLVCNDSAPTHLGSAANVPTVTIFGSTTPEFGFGPVALKNKIMEIELSCRPCTDHGRKKCPIKTLACLQDISPDEVFKSALELMN